MRNRSRLHIMRVWHPRQRAGIAIACPVDSLAHRATASCTPIVHPPSCQPGPSGNRQLHDHCAPAQLPAWPIGQPPAARPAHTHWAPAQLPAWPIGQPPAARPAHTQLHRELSRSSWAALQCRRQHPPPQSPRTYDLSAPFPPHITDEDETRMPVFKCLPN